MLLVRFEDLLINREDCIVSLNEFLDLNYTSDNKVFLYRHYIAKKFLIEFNKLKATSPGYALRRVKKIKKSIFSFYFCLFL